MKGVEVVKKAGDKMAGYYPTDNEILKFSNKREDLEKVRFNHYLTRKENAQRMTGELPKGQFYFAERIAAFDLEMNRGTVRGLVRLFCRLKIITKVFQPPMGSRDPSIYQYNSVSLAAEIPKTANPEKQHEGIHEDVHEEVSDINGLSGHSNPEGIHEDVHEINPSQKELKKELKKGVGSPDFKRILDLYKEHCSRLPEVYKLSDKRKQTLKAWGDLEEMEQVFKTAGQSDFLCGLNDRNWIANFDWIIKPENRLKILEGNYSKRTPADPPKRNIRVLK